MKRWSQEAIELLRQQSEESRNGQPITPGNGIDLNSSSNSSIRVKINRTSKTLPENVAAVILANNPDYRLELRVKKPRRSNK